MGVWIENLKRLFLQKEVIILHGNVRDTNYINKDGELITGFTDLLRTIGKDMNYDKVIFWGTYFDGEGNGCPPMWSLERIESFRENKIETRTSETGDREIQILTKWLSKEIKNRNEKTIFVINYVDKITPYSQRGAYSKDIALLITLIEKLIENISPNNRLVLVALQDTMVPLEYYTNSPRVAVMEIPMPDKEERKNYFSKHFSFNLGMDQLDLLSNITDGLHVRDLDNILRDVVESARQNQITDSTLRKIVNKYRIGSEDDPWLKLPLEGPPKGLIDSAENWFKDRIVGQDYAIMEVVNAIKKARAGVVGLASGQASKPKAVFFFAGPTGVGKTFLAKKLAEYLFDTDEAFIRLDMSEYKEEHTVSKLIGSPPGYVGYEKGGQLTNAIKSRPFSVILFDEIEKAHPKIMDIFLQLLDDGRLTDSRGQTVFFTESVIIFTSNIGTRTNGSGGQSIREREELEDILKIKNDQEREKMIRQHFVKAVQEFFIYEISRPELLNRIGSHIVSFNYISQENIKEKIIKNKLDDIKNAYKDKFSHLGYRLDFSPEVVTYFKNKYGESIEKFGGRGLVNAIDDEIGHIIAEQMLYAEKYQLKNTEFRIKVENETLKCVK